MRSGLQAGNRDINVVGDHKKEKDGPLSDLPKFTPYNCGFFKQTISSKSQQKLQQGIKDRNRSSEEAKLTSDKVKNPIYDTKNYKKFLT